MYDESTKPFIRESCLSVDLDGLLDEIGRKGLVSSLVPPA